MDEDIDNKDNKYFDNDEIYFNIEGVKSQTNNETFSAEAELDNLSENGISNDGSLQFSFGILTAEIQNLLEN